MVRLGKWAENKVYFRDTTTGKRAIQWSGAISTAKRDRFYRLCWFGRVTIPAIHITASGVGRGEFGKTYGGRIIGATAAAIIARHNGSYATTAWGHGIDNVIGAFAMAIGGGGGGATTQPTAYRASILSATVVSVKIEGYTAGTVNLALFVWGATTLAY